MRRTSICIFMLSLLALGGCKPSTQEKTSPRTDSAEDNQPAAHWKALPGVLDFYDEVKKVQANFKLETFTNGELSSEVSGTYAYSKGESVWHYKGTDGSLQRIVECYVDRAAVKAPKAAKRRRRRHRHKKAAPVFAVVAEHQAKYPCVLQALVHYSGAIRRNRLDHDGKVYLVNKFDESRRQITKITMVKGTVTMVYSFANIVFIPMDGMKLPWDKPKPVAVTPKSAAPATPAKAEPKPEPKAPAKPTPVAPMKPAVSEDDEKPPI